jgi:serine/threonine protein kinase/tetratricopeptide (TPR) repeat protein
MSTVVGNKLSRYTIVEELGAGGMGVVYRARDERLQRDVALKVLPPEPSVDGNARRRFQREAQYLAQLSHVNIASIYDFDTDGEVDFLVMEYIDGAAMNIEIRRRSSDAELADLGMQLAAGLEAAHERGVVHRDIKPANLIVTPSGCLKILDFGVARLKASPQRALTDDSTVTHGVSGTPPYMSPEQLREEELDPRTDIWAAGAVLYEVATGERPFRASTSAALTDAILNRDPESPRVRNQSLSVAASAIIMKCLKKDPAARYQTARELADDFGRMLSGPAADVGSRPVCTSLAVLPLTNFSSAEEDYFADGLSEGLITELAQIRSLRVISRTSSMTYKGSTKPLPEIGRELGVDAVIEGSIQRAGTRVRITTQLIHVATDRHLWASTYDRELRDVLSVQAEVAGEVAREIGLQLTAMRPGRSTIVPEAFDAFLRGNFQSNNWELQKAQIAYERAIELDPDFAAAYARLSGVYYFLAFLGVMPPRDAFEKVRVLSATALAKDPQLAEALGQRALLSLHYDWDWFAAERDFRRAEELDPSFADNHHYYAHFLLAMNRPHDNVDQMRKAVALDPQNPVLRVCHGWHRLFAAEYDSAVADADRAAQMAPNLFWSPMVRGWAFEQQGRLAEALTEFEAAIAQSGALSIAVASRAHSLALLGRKEEAALIANELIERSRSTYVPAYEIAVVFAGLGDLDSTFAWLQNAIDDHSTWLVHVGWDARFRKARNDPRFRAIIRSIGLPVPDQRTGTDPSRRV